MNLKEVAASKKNAPSILKKLLEELTQKTKSFEGRSKKVKTALGNKIDATFMLVEADQLITSHTANGAENPNFPKELQPRDRERETSQAWVQKTAADLDPELLGVSSMADRGAPIIGPDYIVESGNGRTMAVQLAYARGQAQAYVDWLQEEAEYFGLSAQQVKHLKQPVLVRMRKTEVNRAQFAIEANQDDKLTMSNTERAQADAKRIDDNMLQLFMPSDDGDLLAVSNRKFLSKFMEKLGDAESAQYVDSNGQFTQSFVLRVKQAVFAKAYADERLLEMMADHSKPELQNMINGLALSAPKFIQAKAVSKRAAGQLDDVTERIVDGMEKSLDQSVLDAIVDASNTILQAKRNNQDITEFVSQQGLFGDLPEGVAEIAVFIAQNSRSAKKLGLFFEALADFVEKQGLDNQNLGLFGEPEPVSVKDAVIYAQQVYDRHYKNNNISLFDSIVDYEQSIDELANQAATSPLNDLPEPTIEQQKSGDYQKGIIEIDGLTIAIENPAGSVRRGVDANGQAWENQLQHHYGYIVGSQGADGDELDIFVKKGMQQFNGLVYVIYQIDPSSGAFDEHKLVIGAQDIEDAKQIYLSNYEKDWKGFKNIHVISWQELKNKLNRVWGEFDSINSHLARWIEEADIPVQDEYGNWYDAEDGSLYDPSILGQTPEKKSLPRYSASESVKSAREYVKPFGGKALKGTIRQKEWAEKLRANLVSKLADHPEVVKNLMLMADSQHAKFWIENRDLPIQAFVKFVDLYVRAVRGHNYLLKLFNAIQDLDQTNTITRTRPIVDIVRNSEREFYQFSESKDIQKFKESFTAEIEKSVKQMNEQFPDGVAEIKRRTQPPKHSLHIDPQLAVTEPIQTLHKMHDTMSKVKPMFDSAQPNDAVKQKMLDLNSLIYQNNGFREKRINGFIIVQGHLVKSRFISNGDDFYVEIVRASDESPVLNIHNCMSLSVESIFNTIKETNNSMVDQSKTNTIGLFDSANAQLDKVSGPYIPTEVAKHNAISILHSMRWAMEYSQTYTEKHGEFKVVPEHYVTSDMIVVPDAKNGLTGEFARLKPSSGKKVKEVDVSYEPKEGKKLMTQALKKAFPNVRFSIKASRGNGYRVSWFNGPSKTLVAKITDHFESRGRGHLDPTGDYWESGATKTAVNAEGQTVFYGVGEIELDRQHSRDFIIAVLAHLKAYKVRQDSENSYVRDANGDLYSMSYIDQGGTEDRQIVKIEKNFHGDFYLTAPDHRRWGGSAMEAVKMFSESRYNLGDLPKADIQIIDEDEQKNVKISFDPQSDEEFLKAIVAGDVDIHADNIQRALAIQNPEEQLYGQAGDAILQHVLSSAKHEASKAFLQAHQQDGAQDQMESALCALAYEECRIEHTAKSGNVLHGFGIAAKGLKRNDIAEFDKATFYKDGTFFVRLKHVHLVTDHYLTNIQILAKEVLDYEPNNRNTSDSSQLRGQSGGSDDAAAQWSRLERLARGLESSDDAEGGNGNGEPRLSGTHAQRVSSSGNRADESTPGTGDHAAHDGQRSGARSKPGLSTTSRRDRKLVSAAKTFASSLEGKAKLQAEASAVETQWGDMDNINDALPYLLPEQRDDVLKAEKRLIENNENGILFTNGTGTGKTFTGLGNVKRFVNAGRGKILILTISDKVARDFVKSGKPLGLNLHQLSGISDNGGDNHTMVVTTFENFAQNDTLVQKEWDLIVVDEAHKLIQNAKGESTKALKKLRALSGHHAGYHAWVKAKHADRYPKKSDDHQPSDEEWRQWDEFSKPLEAQWQENWRNQTGKTKVIFLSATPFAYVPTIEWAEGYLFHFTEPKQMWSSAQAVDGYGYNSADARERFYMQNFGFRMRYNKLTRPEGKVDSGVFERQFAEKLKTEGAMSGRDLVIDFDYDRKFVLIESKVGQLIDEGLDFLSDAKNLDGSSKYSTLAWTIRKRFDYLTRKKLLEAIKAEECTDYVKKHLALGRKVIIFHDLKVGGGLMPFKLRNGELGNAANEDGSATKLMEEYALFEQERPDLVRLNLQYAAPIYTLQSDFPNALVFNGDVSNAAGAKIIEKFNDDNGKHNVLIVQSDKGSTGISLHDTTGKNQRVIINIGMPTKPTKLRQTEGRIYRTGQASNAIHRYFTTGTKWERYAFAETIASRAETVDNLAKGDDVGSSIQQALVEAYESADYHEPSALDGVGGKASDLESARVAQLTPFDKALTYYYAKGKNSKSRQNREGKDWFATPEPLGYKMLEWAGVHSGDKVLEPSAGDGAIARFAPKDVAVTMVEPSEALASRARMANPDATLIESNFEQLDTINKYHAIVMNPPFGHAGSLAMAHVQKAFAHLYDGGRIVALIPRGAMDDKLANWMAAEKEAYLAAEINLPGATFKNAGTAVMTRIVLIEKHILPQDALHPKYINFTHADSPEELFEMIRDIDVAPRKMRIDEQLLHYGLYLEVSNSKYIFSGPGLNRPEIKKALLYYSDAYASDGDIITKYNRADALVRKLKEIESLHKIDLAAEP